MSLSKPFSKCSLSDLAPAISEDASAASASALDPATADRLLPALRNAALTEAVLLRHPLVRDRSGLKCDGSVYSKRAWCGMLRDLAGAAGVEASDAALLRVYLVCKECAKRERTQLCSTAPASGSAAAEQGGALAASPAPAAAPRSGCASSTLSAARGPGGRVESSRAPQRQQKQSMPSSSAAAAAASGALAASPAPAAAPRSASSTLSAARGGRVESSRATQLQQKQSTPSSSAAAAASGFPTFGYQDHLLGKVSVIPVAQRHQLDAPLIFVKAWLRFSRGRRAALGTALPQPPPPVDLTQLALWPAQRARGMPELTATACHRLSTAPASLNVYFRVASGWRALILDRVVSGYINKIQQTRDGAYKCVIFNGHVYKSLGSHDPHSTQVINEYAKMYDLDPAWHICSPTPDALHVCAAYPWAAYALVFADGSLRYTAQGPNYDASFTPGKMACSSGFLRQQREQYGSCCYYFVGSLVVSDVLIARKL